MEEKEPKRGESDFYVLFRTVIVVAFSSVCLDILYIQEDGEDFLLVTYQLIEEMLT